MTESRTHHLSLNYTETDTVLYRGVHDTVLKDMISSNLSHGTILHEKGFLNCSLIKGHESKSKWKLRIYVPRHTNALYLGNVNNEQHYYEVVLQQGSILKMISYDGEYINCRIQNNVLQLVE